MEITVLSAYETSAKEFFEGIQKAKADVVVDVRLHNTNQLAGFTKEGDLAYFIPAILKIPYIHDTRFAPSDNLLSTYLQGGLSFEGYGKNYRHELEMKNGKNLFLSAYPYASVVIIGTTTRKRHSHAEVLKQYLEEK
jgi:Uncharacterized conserved protein